MNIIFITFADGNEHLLAAADRLTEQARETEWFTRVASFNWKKLSDFSQNWVAAHQQFVFSNPRGFGYFIWKPFVIFELIKLLPMGSILVYADAGYEISRQGHDRFNQYIEMANDYNLLGFHIDEKIYKWTKSDLLHYFGIPLSSMLLEDNQIQAGLLFIRKCPSTVAFVSHWSELAVAKNYSLINDLPSEAPSHEKFVEHRHDQSILTLLAKTHEIGRFPKSEDYYPELFSSGQYIPSYPFQCFRNKTGYRRIPMR